MSQNPPNTVDDRVISPPRKRPNVNSPTKRPGLGALRMRSDSDGSVHHAFYSGNIPSPKKKKEVVMKHRREKRRATKRGPETTQPFPALTDASNVTHTASLTNGVASRENGLASAVMPRALKEPDFARLPPIRDVSNSGSIGSASGTLTPSPQRQVRYGAIQQSSIPEEFPPSHARSHPTDRSQSVDSLRYSGVLDGSMGLSPMNAASGAPLFGTDFLQGTDFAQQNLSPAPPPYGWTGGALPQPMPPGVMPGMAPPPAAPMYYNNTMQQQQQDISMFSSMVQAADYGPPPTRNDFPAQGTGYESSDLESSAAPSSQYRNIPQLPSSDDSHNTAEIYEELDRDMEDMEKEMSDYEASKGLIGCFMALMDPTDWLTKNVQFEENGTPYFDDSMFSLSSIVRNVLYNPIYPEFTSLQQFSWAVIIGIAMGFYTAIWKLIIETCVDFMWKDVPETLLEWGVFTELDGSFPIYHYMWITPAICGGILSYIFVILPTPIPGQNEWIHAVHSRGVQDYRTFWQLFVLSTAAMASGLSLGPELPLILTAGMAGSWLGLLCKQSMLQARVMNLTAASAAVGGFFGFPMAGALFVLEVPHRMGLQYFEALSPATIASIVATLCNRLVIGNDVTGYYSYPFLSSTLPSEIFTSAIVYGLFGALVGICYSNSVLKLKTWVHDLFHKHDDHHDGDGEQEDEAEEGTEAEQLPLVGDPTKKVHFKPKPTLFQAAVGSAKKLACCVIPHEPYRAAVAGTLVGAVVGTTCIFIPSVAFWGEAQLQYLIDKGRTPLPVFGRGDEPTAGLTSLGYCLIDHDDAEQVRHGFGIGCSFIIASAKIFVTGLSLGTGIVGGHFWGPLFTGCAASHFLNDVATLAGKHIGFGGSLATYPCVTILCMMGSTHVVTFRAHMAIMLILTLTISAFDPEDQAGSNYKVAGDYSAVFPLLVVSVFVSLMVSRQTVFYKTQRSRGDIMALPEVLCEPGKEGTPLVVDYEGHVHIDSDHESDDEHSGSWSSSTSEEGKKTKQLNENLTQSDIERAFEQKSTVPTTPAEEEQAVEQVSAGSKTLGDDMDGATDSKPGAIPTDIDFLASLEESLGKPVVPKPSSAQSPLALPPRPQPGGRRQRLHSAEMARKRTGSTGSDSFNAAEKSEDDDFDLSKLDELLSKPIAVKPPSKRSGRHRRIHSAPIQVRNVTRHGSFEKRADGPDEKKSGNRDRSNSTGKRGSKVLVRVSSYGELSHDQPSLLDQARLRAASASAAVASKVPIPPSGRLSRQNTPSSLGGGDAETSEVAGLLSLSDIERTFSSVLNQQTLYADSSRRAS